MQFAQTQVEPTTTYTAGALTPDMNSRYTEWED